MDTDLRRYDASLPVSTSNDGSGFNLNSAVDLYNSELNARGIQINQNVRVHFLRECPTTCGARLLMRVKQQ